MHPCTALTAASGRRGSTRLPSGQNFHLGLGGFYRAHMARYTHALMHLRPDTLGLGIVGAGLMPGNRRMQESLAPQDNLYTLMERSGNEEAVTVIGSLAGAMFAGDGSGALLNAIDGIGLSIVSLMVTANGYCLNRSTKQLDPGHPLILRDLAQSDRSASTLGIIVETARRRRDTGAPAFTVMSCDNIEHNGDVLRAAVLAFARLRDPALADWIAGVVTFPNTMVDRITPVTAEADTAHLALCYGIADCWPVVAETFIQWVTEDRLAVGRPEWEVSGEQFVADVAPHEFMKLRLLNASQLAVAGLGRLMGYVTIDEATANPLLTPYMAALIEWETGPNLGPGPGVDLRQCQATLIERFAKPAIKDTVERVNTDAPLNILLDPIRDRLRTGGSVGLLALALAAWLRQVRGTGEQGGMIEVRHPFAVLLRDRAEKGGSDPARLSGLTQLFGELGSAPRLVTPVSRLLSTLYRQGSRAALADAAGVLAF